MSASRLATLLALLALALFGAACGDDEEDSAGGGAATAAADGEGGSPCAGGKVVGYAQPLPDPNFQVLGRVVKQELEREGCTVRITNANLDPGKQVSDIQTLQQQGVDVLITNPVVPQAIQPAIDRLRQRNVPVIVQETRMVKNATTNVTSDVEQAAADGARLAQELAGENGTVAAIKGPTLAEILVRENNGFDAAARELRLDVVDEATNTRITPDGAREIANRFKQREPDLDVIWTFNDTSALGAMSVKDAEWDPEIVSINGQPEAVEAIKRGQIHTTFALQQVKIGHTLAYAAREALAGRQLPKEINLPLAEVNRENAGRYIPPDRAVSMPFEVRLQDRGGKTYVDTGSSITG